mmetsp:Transcript_22096/g.33394  ORF Transcript_22096/g.33394 Transcript_22096/m.33394 type:complete len:110 (-) Transcript_22096:298-627(-)
MNTSRSSSVLQRVILRNITTKTTPSPNRVSAAQSIKQNSTIPLPRTGWKGYSGYDDVMPSSSNRTEYRSEVEGTLEQLLEAQSLGANDTSIFQQVVKSHLNTAESQKKQ